MPDQFTKVLEYWICNRKNRHNTDTIRMFVPRRIMEE